MSWEVISAVATVIGTMLTLISIIIAVKKPSKPSRPSKPPKPSKQIRVLIFASVGITILIIPLWFIFKPDTNCASSSYQSDFFYCWQCTCGKAFDNNSRTRWASAWTDAEWIVRDLGDIRTFDTIVLQWESACAKEYAVDISDNGVVWNEIYTQTNSHGDAETIHLPLTTARYVRIRGITRATAYGYSLFEFKIYLTATSP